MTEKLKIVFHVEDAEKRVVIPQHQAFVEFDSWTDLAVDDAEIRLKLRGRSTLPESEKEELTQVLLAARRRDQALQAAGEVICRFIGAKLQEWARNLLKVQL